MQVDRETYEGPARAALARIASALGSAHQNDVAALEALFDQLAQLERREQKLREQQAALAALARSEGGGSSGLAPVTETAARMLDVARSSVWLYNADRTAIQCVDLFLRNERAHESGVELFAKDFPGYFAALREERTIAAHDAHRDPRTREFSESYLSPLGIRSMLDAPIYASGTMIGVVCNEHVGAARTWTVEEEQFAASVADFVALAIESARRADVEAQLRAMLAALEGS